MRTIIFVTLQLAASLASAGESESWFRDWPQNSIPQEIPASRVFEIPHSLFESAENLLINKPYIAIGDNYFSGFRYDCPHNFRAYLVRALYEHANTGTFQVFRSENNLLIRHYALGEPSEQQRSALIICLDFTPDQVYVATGGAM